MGDNIFMEAALSYADRGWHIFPCVPKTKIPKIKKGSRGATVDRELIRSWWERWPDANVALLCGPMSGVYVIDVDVDEELKVDGRTSLDEMQAEYGPLPDTVYQDTPRGGRHYLFKADKPPANKNDFRNGVDIRSDGYYIMLEPSVHPDFPEIPYKMHLDKTLAVFPDHFRPENEKPTPFWMKDKKPIEPRKTPVKRPDDNSIIERAIAYLDTVDAAMQGHGGHNRLMWAARAMVDGFELDDRTAIDLLWKYYNPRCIPPWDPNKPSEVKDFERKVSECRKKPGDRPPGWALQESMAHDETLLDYGNKLAEEILAEVKPKKTKTVTTNPKNKKKPKKTHVEIPDWILKPPGLVGKMVGWFNTTSIKNQPFLSLGASLVLCGALFGRKVRDELNNRTNLYVMSVAPSSAGKNHARRQLKRLLKAANSTRLLGGEEVTSAAAIENRLCDFPCTLFPWDEMGHFMKNLKNSNNDAHLSSIRPMLMKLYSSAADVYSGKEYADKPRKEIYQPCCCIYGTTTPEKLAEGITPDEIEDGWLGRVLCFISTDRPRKDHERAKNMDIPELLINQVESWMNRQIQAPPDTGDILAATECWQIVVPTRPEAEDCFLQFDELCYKEEVRPNIKGIGKLWGKAEENARKIALVLAAGDSFEKPEINYNHAQYACELVEILVRQMSEMADEHIAYGRHDKDKQYIYRMIKETGPDGIWKKDVTNRTRQMSPRQREDCIKDLLESVVIVAKNVSVNKKGRPSVRYYMYPYGLE